MDDNEKEKSRSELLVATGLPSTGKSSVIRCLEDTGYFYVGNLPPVSLPKSVESMEQGSPFLRKVVTVIDLRGKELLNSLVTAVDEVESENDVIIDVMFLEASTEKLVSRYKEARRTHPLMEQGKRSLIDAINDEREYLSQTRSIADFVIDTTKLPPKESKERIRRYYEDEEFKTSMTDITGFGFEHGIQIDTDLIFDVRFLPSPYYVVDLRSLTGLDKDICNHITKWKEVEIFFEKSTDLLDLIIPGHKKERKSWLVTAIDCTDGQHRSVVLAERLGNYLSGVFEYNVYVRRRDAHTESGEKKRDK